MIVVRVVRRFCPTAITAMLVITSVTGCCAPSGGGLVGERQPAVLMELLTGCSFPADASDIGVFAVEGGINLIVDARFDVPVGESEAFLDCWRARGGTLGGPAGIVNGHFGDHTGPVPLANASGGELTLVEPLRGGCEILYGRRASSLDRVYLRCTFDHVSRVPELRPAASEE